MQPYKSYFTNKKFLLSFFSGFLLLTISLVINFFASSYATHTASGSVQDIILSNTRVYDIDGIFVYGTVILFFICLIVCIMRPKYFPFVLKSYAFFIIVRSIFVILTHISPYPLHVAISSDFFNEAFFKGIFTGDDLFFSGHTGAPFFFALMFWHDKFLRNIFLAFSIVFATVVLLGHLHYSIDVLSAFFIAYGIFHICRLLFKKDWELFLKK